LLPPDTFRGTKIYKKINIGLPKYFCGRGSIRKGKGDEAREGKGAEREDRE